MIKAVILDFYGVIQTDEVIVWAEKQVSEFPNIRQAVDEASRKIDLNEISLEEYYQELATAVNRPVDAVKAELANEITINWPLLDIVGKLRDQGIKTAILSNDGSSLLAYLEEHDISQHFDEVFVSGELGMMKPDPRVYKYAANKLGIEISDSIFFDDRQTNVDGATRAGMQAELFTSNRQVQKLLS
jgi:putative hydrolase of the HAD superfamily